MTDETLAKGSIAINIAVFVTDDHNLQPGSVIAVSNETLDEVAPINQTSLVPLSAVIYRLTGGRQTLVRLRL